MNGEPVALYALEVYPAVTPRCRRTWKVMGWYLVGGEGHVYTGEWRDLFWFSATSERDARRRAEVALARIAAALA